MLHGFKRFMSVLLLAAMVFTGTVLANQSVCAAATPQQVNDAIDKFVTAVGKFGASDASGNIGQIANFCSRLGGFTSAASGVIGILQMVGIIKDPTTQMLGKVLDAVKDVQTTLDNMKQTLNDIRLELLSLQIEGVWNNRNNRATTMSTNWNSFNTNYTEKLQTYVGQYQAKINSGIKAWWEQDSHEGVYVLLTKDFGDADSLTYSRKKYSEGLPAKSDINDETVDTAWSIGIPAECMPNTRAVTFNIDTYRDDFKKIMVTALENAIKDNKLASNCGASVKSEYSGSSRQAMLGYYADYVLDTVIYKISCEVMTAENSWVAEVVSLYQQYCKNTLERDSGINAFLNYIFLTHAFEGEVRDQIERFIDAMIAQVGFYGQFAMTCAGQDSLQTTATKEDIQTCFTRAIISLDQRKETAIIGKDNYCYITSTILKADTVAFSSGIYVALKRYGAYKGCDVDSWSIKVPSIVNSVYMPIIYKQYEKLSQGTNSFGAYLNKYGVQSDTSNKLYMTRCNGVQTFALSDGIPMCAQRVARYGNYFAHDEWYRIDVGTGSKVERQYYHCHDKIVGDWFDSSNGKPDLGAVIAARAFYGEHHDTWSGRDEAWGFASDGVSKGSPHVNGDVDRYAWFSRTIDIIKSEACHSVQGDDDEDPGNPFFAYDHPSISELAFEIGPSYENTSKDITEVLLDSESFAYTGQPIEPDVTVFASDDVVPEEGYTVTYINNIESGDYGVVRVEGKGDYAGVITRHFEITESLSEEDSSEDSSSTGYRRSSSSGCNAMNCAGLLLGLAFVIRKFRRH